MVTHFDEIQECSPGDVVEIRGFWTPLGDGEGALSPNAGLKSCCVNISQQHVLVRGEVKDIPLQQAVTLQGVVSIKPVGPGGNAEIVIDRAQLISQPVSEAMSSESTWIAAVLLLLGAFFFKKLWRR